MKHLRTSPSHVLRAVGVLLLAAAAAACDGSSTGSRPAAAVAVQSGNGQQSTVGSMLPNPLVVRVSDANGQPVRGAAVQWTVVSGGGVVEPAASTTDAAGLAQAQWRLGGVGAQSVTATVAGVAQGATFTATAQAAPSGGVLTRVSGDAQTGAAGTELAQPLVVEFRQNGVPVSGVQVTWTPSAGAAGQPSVTDALGRASTRWLLGPQVGTQQLVAQVSGADPVTFSATAQAGAPALLEPGAAASPAKPRGGTDTLVARVLDAAGNPVAGAVVQWSVLRGGGTITASSTSGADGVARAVWTLDGTATSQIARAQVAGTGVTAVFNRYPPPAAGPPASAVKVSGDGQSTYLYVYVAQSLVVRVLDAQGRGVPGVPVRWTGVRTPAASDTLAVATDEAGYSRILPPGATTTGPRTVRATVPGIATPLDFTLTTTLGPGGRLIALYHDVHFDAIGQRLDIPFVEYRPDGTVLEVVTYREGSSWVLLDNTGAVQIATSGNLTRYLRSMAEGQDRLEISRPGASGARIADTVAVTVQQVVGRLVIQSSTQLRVGQTGSAYLQSVIDALPIVGTAWSSSDPSIVSVAADGTYTAVAPGVAVIRGEKNGKAFEFAVSVR
jgi:hypothetical protein